MVASSPEPTLLVRTLRPWATRDAVTAGSVSPGAGRVVACTRKGEVKRNGEFPKLTAQASTVLAANRNSYFIQGSQQVRSRSRKLRKVPGSRPSSSASTGDTCAASPKRAAR